MKTVVLTVLQMLAAFVCGAVLFGVTDPDFSVELALRYPPPDWLWVALGGRP